MNTQQGIFFSQLIYLTGRMALLDDKTSEHWKELQDQPAVEVSLPGRVHDAASEVQPRRKNLTGRDLKQLRTAARLSTTEFASLLGVNPFAISRWEEGRAGIPARTAEAIRKCLVENAA